MQVQLRLRHCTFSLVRDLWINRPSQNARTTKLEARRITDEHSSSPRVARLQEKLQALAVERNAASELAHICTQRCRRLLARVQSLRKYAADRVAEGDIEAARSTLKTKAQVQETLELTISRGKNNQALAAKLEELIGYLQYELSGPHEDIDSICTSDDLTSTQNETKSDCQKIEDLLGGPGRKLLKAECLEALKEIIPLTDTAKESQEAIQELRTLQRISKSGEIDVIATPEQCLEAKASNKTPYHVVKSSTSKSSISGNQLAEWSTTWRELCATLKILRSEALTQPKAFEAKADNVLQLLESLIVYDGISKKR